VAVAPFKEVGLSLNSKSATVGARMLTANYGYDTQQSSGPELASFPCNGTVLKVRNFYQEVPNPLENFGDTNANGSAGHALVIQSKSGSVLEVISATISRSGLPVATRGILTKSNDVNNAIQSHQAAVIPVWDSLVNGATYDVAIQAKIDGVTVTKAFSFSVASDAARF
jgi:hypothetical protein